MLDVSYAISPRLKENLNKIENTRKRILLTPITPANELKLRWEASFNRTYCCLKLSKNTLSRKHTLRILGEAAHKKMDEEEQEVIRYKNAQDFMSQHWLASSESITVQTIIDLYRKIGTGILRLPRGDLQNLLDYLQQQSENPIVMAGIMHIQMEKSAFFSASNIQIANLTAQLFLFKYGYDFKGFLSYELLWLDKDDISKEYIENRKRALESPSLTLWLEYFSDSVLKTVEKILDSIEKPKEKVLSLRKSFWNLNERQKAILSYLEQPQSTITNREVQKRYKTSQITASRDLAKLTNLGLLFSYGKGRSVYYTKI